MVKKLEKGKFLIACSGGPDSMFLLHAFKHLNPVVAHVNYQLRKESDAEEKLVKNFCYANQLRFVVLRPSLQSSKNLQHVARQLRYDFFYKIAKKYNLNCLLTAHHRDDLLESYFLKQNCKGFFVSIPKHSFWKDLPVLRPFLYTHWKSQILKWLKEQNISFAQDSSNHKLVFARNKIRSSLQTLSFFSKYWLLLKCWIKDWRNLQQFQRSQNRFISWKQNGFEISEFKGWNQREQVRQLILFFQNSSNSRIKFSSRKLGGIISFILASNQADSFKLNNNLFLKKTKTKQLMICWV